MRPRPPRLAARALSVALFLAGAGASLFLLGRPSLGQLAIWLGLFVAAIAFAVINRESNR